MALTNSQVKTAVLIGKYGACLDACDSGSIITGTFNLICPVKVRGGKGTPMRRRQPTIDHYIYKTPLDNVMILSSNADIEFYPAKFAFIKSLPKPEIVDHTVKIPLETPVEFEVFTYDAIGGKLIISGYSDVTHFDLGAQIIAKDDEFIKFIGSDLLSNSTLPSIEIPVDMHYVDRKERLHREDQEILSLLGIL